MSGNLFSSANISNVDFIESIYEQFLKDPNSVDRSWACFFQGFEFSRQMGSTGDGSSSVGMRVSRLIRAFRRRGHLIAQTNPLEESAEHKRHPQLQLEYYGLSEADLDKEFPTDRLMEKPFAPLRQIMKTLKEIYCSTVAVEYMDIQDGDTEAWFQQRMEPSLNRPDLSIEDKRTILECLNRAEMFENFLHTKFVGQKRFSLEGAEVLIPALKDVIDTGAEFEVNEVVIGMAHRGRLNVLTSIMNKSYEEVFTEFEDNYAKGSREVSGDVKYHKGFTSKIKTKFGKDVVVSLGANPSHLEAIDPVTLGKTKAKQIMKGDAEQKKILPVLVHGDASIAGQGIVYECFQMSHLEGYSVGGTLHIVVNNQVGFTTMPEEARSSLYCTDVAKVTGAPVFHVNGNDPEGVVHAVRVAIEYLQRFKNDVIIDIVCYRKYGHNEGDEPSFTSPLLYKKIKKMKTVREMYLETLIERGHLEKAMAKSLEVDFKKGLSEALEQIRKAPHMGTTVMDGVWSKYEKAKGDDLFIPVETAVPEGMLKDIAEKITTIPDGFKMLPQLKRVVDKRRTMLDENASIDWAMAEHLCFGSLLWEGCHVRLSGQDSQRGTFSHRHSVWTDSENEEKFTPLKNLKEGQGRFDVYNSLLSEYAVMGFEYGYSLSYPNALVMWEAQFGDFANGAQIIIDQFYCTSEQKWNRFSGLVLLLPHGQEGQGPEHSSARLERFLSNSSQDNIQVTIPTTPSQLFHVLRRQVVRNWRRPLVVCTPKGFLRHPKAVSPLTEFTEGVFQEVLDDAEAPEKVKRIMICSGKVYYDLQAEREKRGVQNVAIVRLEQIYPFHAKRLKEIMDKHNPEEVMWVQEEPVNQGAFSFVRDRLQQLLSDNHELLVASRAEAASPAVGSKSLYDQEFEKLMNDAFEGL